MKWKGFTEPTWELRESLNDTEALDLFEKKFSRKDNDGEDEGAFICRKKLTKRVLMAAQKIISDIVLHAGILK